MTPTLVARSVAVSVAALTGALLASGPAESAPVPVKPNGTVQNPTGVNERVYPSTDSSVRGTLVRGTRIGLRCKVRAQAIAGNSVWYQLRDRATWVSSVYVSNVGNVPVCKDMQRSALDDAPTTRAAMG
ncbi:SH3 domain-containing protein [Streptomyces sp. ISL-11]|uniref:SH3 domain-containing protein n=1 Tax=Streptomyces sp. ISL-11 TaxID=2819174 RepID=UPI001BEA9997|nr:SH3 domain-containing protein [Streptomyces sp. ISL-11]MBT2382056.1 SH3 domain-containing protein [Streptomyces sp. ISL-11]